MKNLVAYGLGLATGLVAVPATKLGIKAVKELKARKNEIKDEIVEEFKEEFELDIDNVEEEK